MKWDFILDLHERRNIMENISFNGFPKPTNTVNCYNIVYHISQQMKVKLIQPVLQCENPQITHTLLYRLLDINVDEELYNIVEND